LRDKLLGAVTGLNADRRAEVARFLRYRFSITDHGFEREVDTYEAEDAVDAVLDILDGRAISDGSLRVGFQFWKELNSVEPL
jgi:hypothetical protein